MNMNEPPSLLRNDYEGANRWLKVKLVGTRSNRAGIGATVVVTAGGRPQAQAVLSQSSYYSHDDLRLHFGLGAARAAEQVEVRWPSGGVDVVRDVAPNRVLTIREGHARRERRPLPQGQRDLAADVVAAGTIERHLEPRAARGRRDLDPGRGSDRPRRAHADS